MDQSDYTSEEEYQEPEEATFAVEEELADDRDQEAPADDQDQEEEEEAPADDQDQEEEEEAPADDQDQEEGEEEAPADDQDQEEEEEAPADDQDQEEEEEAPADDQEEEEALDGAEYAEEMDEDFDVDEMAGKEKSKSLGDDVDYGDEEDDEVPSAARKGGVAMEIRRGMKVFPAIQTAIRIANYRGFIIESIFGQPVPLHSAEWPRIRTLAQATEALLENGKEAAKILRIYKNDHNLTETALKSMDVFPFLVAVACPLIAGATSRFICHVHNAPSDAHMIAFLSAQDKGLNVSSMKKVKDMIYRSKSYRGPIETVAILAMSEPTSPSAKKELAPPIELLLIPKMQCFIPEHFLTPAHTPLTKQDVATMLTHTASKEFQLPCIDKNDPIAVCLGLRPGDAVLFRRVVNGQRSHDYIRRVPADTDETDKQDRDEQFLKRASAQ
jgi:DNA-directed RNA polymerase subunit H (RpoH/RPB5)